MGLMYAAELFDLSKGYRFSTYARSWVHNYKLNAIIQHGRHVRVPSNVAARLRKLDRTLKDLSYGGQTPSVEEIASAMGLNEKEVYELLCLSDSSFLSIQEPVTEGEKSLFEDVFLEDPQDSPLKVLIEQEALSQIHKPYLSEKQRVILTEIYVEDKSLLDVGISYNVSKQNIGRIKNAAISKIRSKLS
jgi:RNA polymerase primary sigma factor